MEQTEESKIFHQNKKLQINQQKNKNLVLVVESKESQTLISILKPQKTKKSIFSQLLLVMPQLKEQLILQFLLLS